MDLIGYLAVGSVFAAVFILVFYAFDEIEGAAEEFQDSQVHQGDSTLGELYIHLSPQAFFYLRSVIAFVLLALGTMAVNIVLGALLAVVGYIIPGWFLKRMKEKRLHKLEGQLVDGLELMGNGLKSGLTLVQAVELLVKEFPPPISQEFNLVLAENRLGVEFTDALDNMAHRLNSITVSILCTGVAITKKCGGDLTEIFNNIAETIREQATVEGKLNAVTAQGRFQGQILSFMPFALIGILWFVDPAHVETLFNYTFGLAAIGVVIGMVFLAQLWIGKLLAIDV